MIALPPSLPVGPEFDEFRERIRYEVGSLRASVSKAISEGSDVRNALSAWKERLTADFRVIVDLPPTFGELPSSFRDYERPDFFEALQGLCSSVGGND